MEVVLPAFAWLCLATLIVASPRIQPHRVRQRAAEVAAGLRTHQGFTPASEVEYVLSTNEPPCHYGTDHALDDVITGLVASLPVTSATYTCRYNGSTHLYGLVGVTLPASSERLEIRHGRVFESAWAVDTPPEGAALTGTPTFDTEFELYFPDRGEGATGLLSQAGINALLAAPDRFSLRIDDRRLLLWRRDGWTSDTTLIEAVKAATTVATSVRLVG
jgi:hypothetical protein